MIDKKNYLKSKILAKLNNPSHENEVSDVLDSLDNVAIMPSYGSSFDDSVIGWLNFVQIIQDLVANNLPITVENVRKAYVPKKTERMGVESRHTVDESLLAEEDPEVKMKRLLSIVDEVDILDDFEQENLTEMGLISSGLIGFDQTSLNAVDVNIPESDMPMVKVKKHEPIISPYTGSDYVCQINSTTFMDIETEQQFKVYIEDQE